MSEADSVMEHHKRNRKRRVRAKTRDPLNTFTDAKFKKQYRISKQAFIFLCKQLKQRAHFKSTKQDPMEIKVLTALQFFGARYYKTSKIVEKHIQEVIKGLIYRKILSKYVPLPEDKMVRQASSQWFEEKYGIPGVIGCIQNTQFIISPPQQNIRKFYYNTTLKNYSLNAQFICDEKHQIITVNPFWGGSYSDAFIWEHGVLDHLMQDWHTKGEDVCFLGDSKYPPKPWLKTPIPDPILGSKEAEYNEKHSQILTLIEETISMLKKQFRCLDRNWPFKGKPQETWKIILSCCVLYNISLKFDNGEDVNESAESIDSQEEYSDID